MNRQKIFEVMVVVGLIWAFSILIYEALIAYGRLPWTWALIPLEMVLVGFCCIAAYIRWPQPLTAVLGLSFFSGCGGLMIIEINNLQHLFTGKFLVACIIILAALVILTGIWFWARYEDLRTSPS